MKQSITITDLTRMREPNVCIAGYNSNMTSIRPIIPHKGGIPEWFLHDRQENLIVRPFAVVEFDFRRRMPEPPHTEDWEITPRHRRVVTRLLPDARKLALLRATQSPSVGDIFQAEIHTESGYFVCSGAGVRSLGTIQPAAVSGVLYQPKPGRGNWDYRISFEDSAGQIFKLAVTDLAFRNCLDHGRRVAGCIPEKLSATLHRILNQRTTFLRIGLARHWEKHPDRCHLQITGIYTFPDYLKGRCFKDFSVAKD